MPADTPAPTHPAGRRAVPAALALLATILAACGGGGGSPSSSSAEPERPASTAAAAPDTDFGRALASVRATETTGAYVEWADLGRLYDAAGVERPPAGEPPAFRELGRWRDLVGFGGGNAVQSSVLLRDDVGVDPLGADELLTVGEFRTQALRLHGGQDAAAIRTALQAAGLVEETSPGGATILARTEEGVEAPDDGESTGPSLGVLRPFEHVALVDDDVVAAASAEGVDDLLQPTPSLAESPAHRAVADCLGDPLAALEFGGRMVERLDGVELIGIGVVARDGGAVNVLCVAGDAAGVAAREAGMHADLDPAAPGADEDRGLRERVASATIGTTAAGDLQLTRAELVLTPDTPATYLFRELYNNGLGEVFVLPPQTPAASSTADDPDGSTAP